MDPGEIAGERYEQEVLRKPERIDKEKGEMYGVRVMGLASQHGYAYTLDAHKAAVKHFEQMAVGIDHDYKGGPLNSESAWGVLSNVRCDEKGTLADLKFLQSHPRTPQILEDIERDIGLFSFSPVTTRNVERPAGSVVSFVPVRCDLVVRGATTRRVFEQTALPEVEALKADVAKMQAELAELRGRQTKYEQFIAPGAADAAVKAAEAAAADKGIDLKKFWNTKE
jgi:hypothetical protein